MALLRRSRAGRRVTRNRHETLYVDFGDMESRITVRIDVNVAILQDRVSDQPRAARTVAKAHGRAAGFVIASGKPPDAVPGWRAL